MHLITKLASLACGSLTDLRLDGYEVLSDGWSSILDAFFSSSQKIRNLILSDDVQSGLSSLTRLELNYCNKATVNLIANSPLPKLKTLIISQNDFDFTRLVFCPNIEDLTIRSLEKTSDIHEIMGGP